MQDSRRMWPAIVLLIVAVLAPTACVLWFMNAAVENERLAVRQRLQDVYGRELTLCQNRVEEHWKKVGEALEASRDLAPAAAFAELVSRGLVESALVYRDGRLAYPRLERHVGNLSLSPAEEQARSLEQAGQFDQAAEAYAAIALDGDIDQRARAMLGEARARLNAERQVESGGGPTPRTQRVPGRGLEGRSEVMALVTGALQETEYETATDFAGRLIAPNAMLLAIESLPADDPARLELVHRLAERLRRYDGPELSSPQRLFLMQQLHQLAGERFSTLAAEILALQSASAFVPPNGSENSSVVHRTGSLPGTWIMTDSTGQTIGIWTNAGLIASLEESLQQDSPAGASFAIHETTQHPSEPAPFLSASVVGSMPDWTVALSLNGPDPFAAAAQRHEAAYLWMACLAIGTIGAGGWAGAVSAATDAANAAQKRSDRHGEPRIENAPFFDAGANRYAAGRPHPQRPRSARLFATHLRENLRLSRLIDNFLTFSRMERQKAAFEFRPLRVQVLVDAALEALGDRAAAVKVSVPPQLTVTGDADALGNSVGESVG